MKKISFVACLLFWMACQNRPGAGTTDPAMTGVPASATSSSAKNSIAQRDTTSLGGTWFLQPVLASDAATGKLPELKFDLGKSHFSGNTGCNNMNGEFWYSANDSSLSFSDKKLISTRMACQGYNEQAFLKSLKNANHYRLKNGVLTLMSDKTELSRWTRKETPLPKSGKA